MNIGTGEANLDPDLLQFSVNEGDADVDDDDDDNDNNNDNDDDDDDDDDDDNNNCDVDGPTVEAFVDLAKMACKYRSTQCH